MNKDEITEIAKVAAREVLVARSDMLESEFDARYHDVGLLLKNYRRLKTHYAKVSPDVLEVNAICSLHSKTGLMMSHVDKMLAAYKAMCHGSNDADEVRRWEVLYLKFLSSERHTADSIAKHLGVDSRTLFRDIRRAKEDMAVLLFGLEAIGSWKHKRLLPGTSRKPESKLKAL